MTTSKDKIVSTSLVEINQLQYALEVVGSSINSLIENPTVINTLKIAQQKLDTLINSDETKTFAESIVATFEKFEKFSSNQDVIHCLCAFLTLPEKRKQMIVNMSKVGWFPFELTFQSIPHDNQTIDDYMCKIIQNSFKEIKEKIISKYPNRKHILEVAFDLIQDENDIAAIPLILSQIDGISHDNQGIYYFTGFDSKFPKMLKEKAQSWDEFQYNLFKEIIDKAHKNFISDRFEDIKSGINEINILNRNGILHGDKDFLDYSKKPNVYKVLSLLLYVDWMSELIDLENNSQI
ncbi:hypothetical protein [uncultured Acinetobacter sp.]|uniref:hypothetical protein n=1 Tax=uncultured Acinetobacter sp. TaxID=165433 RepID=UPI003747A94F